MNQSTPDLSIGSTTPSSTTYTSSINIYPIIGSTTTIADPSIYLLISIVQINNPMLLFLLPRLRTKWTSPISQLKSTLNQLRLKSTSNQLRLHIDSSNVIY